MIVLVALSASLVASQAARADICGDTVNIRFAQFPNSVTTMVSCPGVELTCAGPDLGIPGSCRFSIDVEGSSVRISDFETADYGTGAAITIRDLDPVVCSGTVLGTLSDVEVNHLNSAGFLPEATFSEDSVTVTLAKGTSRWKPGDFIDLLLQFEGDCPQEELTANRSGWVPNVGRLDAEELPLGDLYTFNCPAGGIVDVFVDTKDDLDSSESCLDPVLEIFNSSGEILAVGDDEAECKYPPVCGFGCPAVQGLSCGSGGEFSLVIRDFGTASKDGIFCNKGGGYELELAAFDSSGVPVDASQLALGGGPASGLPAWLSALGIPKLGPVLDDENVPSARARQGLAQASTNASDPRLRQAIRKLSKKNASP